ncbi:MAG: hypothetical protein PVH21_09820 [Myxococcales bacterium]
MRLLVALLSCCAIQCAGASSNAPETEFRESDLDLFDDAVDLVENPLVIESMQGAFERRVARADLIAIVRVESLSSDFIRRRSAYRLAVRIEQRLKGSAPAEMVLRVEADQPGYRTVQKHEDLLLRNAFIAFVKWEPHSADAEPVNHWHLSPASNVALDQVQLVLSKPAADGQTKIEAQKP